MRNDATSPTEQTSASGGKGRVFSIGYSTHEPVYFIDLLKAAGVTALADVRSAPYSRWVPHSNRPVLEPTLREAGILYVFLGDELGGRPRPAELYDAEGRVDYLRVRATAFFRRGIDRLIAAREKFHVAMMCGEEDPLDCHRGLMITPALVERGVCPIHLRGEGSRETTPELEDRLLRETHLDGLFTLSDEDRREALAEAYRAMAKKKAFRLRQDEGE